MRRVLLLCSTIVFGLMSITSASAGILSATGAKATLIASNYTGGLLNKFVSGSMVTAVGGFGSNSNAYSTTLDAPTLPGYNVYLVAATNNTAPGTFSVTFVDEFVKGVAASNGSQLVNIVGSHSSLSGAFAQGMATMFGNPASSYTTLATNFFGTGTNAMEISGGRMDSYSTTLSSVSGKATDPYGAFFVGGGDISLVFTVVPEPTSLGLFGIGALVFGFARSRRKKA